MRRAKKQGLLAALPLVVSGALILSACSGGSGSDENTAQQEPVSALDTAADAAAAQDVGGAAPVDAGTAEGVADAGLAPVEAPGAAPVADAAKSGSAAKTGAKSESGKAKAVTTEAGDTAGLTSIDDAAQRAANARIAAEKNGATDLGVTKDSIKLGTVSMHGVALGNLIVIPMLNGTKATFASINDRGGVLGRRLSLVDCDDGPGEVSRSKACIKKLVGQDKVFALLGYLSWASASVHSDLAQYRLPAVGTWAYSQTEWQDPYMFPTHMSMIHEAMANAQWVKNVVRPKTYGLICLTSPEMQLSCDAVNKVLNASGAQLVKRMDVGISETSMSAQVLAMRAANPDTIVHYVINPATIVKFMVEAAQQGYYPPKGISGNHLAAEVLGQLFGKHPAGRYWTNTTYKLWGSEFMAVMNKYARGNKGLNHHIVQANYVGALVFERAAKAVGPNLTRERLMAQLSNGDVYAADASLDQRFSYSKAERGGSQDSQTWNRNYGQGREFMYKYNTTNTASNPDGSPNGWEPDPDQFVIHTDK
ncbi:ABC transporter substrate-binding protein [Sporichthya polymorpha]|uniref:ABC transporter substrate-binding protein n=1 Tax=Sporichthya polymorpha TaxID=35751 RepID=UPI000360E50A|nr:ABC transporter substrate-binding protein [Sporichthya polymorpha]